MANEPELTPVAVCKVLNAVHDHPGKDGLRLLDFGLTRRDARILIRLEKLGWIEYRHEGWNITSAGDLYRMEHAT
jgi:hypothetical protein